ncbi:unnamed protein product [Symbiodinium pilosum]|uniref:HTTM domain-containing protein n=1 Tax=Symbiodinium pilosum TaxID=2952 RepID=A0A812VED3_SYMPI|nr:unnamed protein product [Symbiodinium pilosum]
MADINWDGDYFDLPKEKFQQMTVGQRLDHFAKRIVKHGMERPALIYRFHIKMLLLNYGGYCILVGLMPRPSAMPTYDYSVLLFAKLLVWQHLAEAFGCRQGPLSGMTFPTNWLYRLSRGTLKYSCLPQLGGNKRNVVDFAVHCLFFISGLAFLFCPWYSFVCIRALFFCDVYLFMFDRTQFYASTAHAYGSMLLSACFPLDCGSFAGMQLGLIMQWFFSGIGKIGPWFQYVNGPFMLQSRWLRGSKWLLKLLVESEDKMTPTLFGTCLAHLAAFVEYFAPIALMVPSNAAIWLGLIGLTAMHVYILLTPAPFDVYSWNLCFCLSGIYLFYIGSFGFDFSSWTDMAFCLRLWLFAEFCLCWYGQFFPDQIGYYLSHRYWAGNWVQTHFMVRKNQTVKDKLDKVDPRLPNPLSLEPTPYYLMCLGYMPFAYTWLATMNMKCIVRLVEDVLNMGSRTTVDDWAFCGLQSWLCGEFRDQIYTHTMMPLIQEECKFDEGECYLIRLGAFRMFQHEASWQIYDAKKGVVREGKLTTEMMSSIDSRPSASMELLMA